MMENQRSKQPDHTGTGEYLKSFPEFWLRKEHIIEPTPFVPDGFTVGTESFDLFREKLLEELSTLLSERPELKPCVIRYQENGTISAYAYNMKGVKVSGIETDHVTAEEMFTMLSEATKHVLTLNGNPTKINIDSHLIQCNHSEIEDHLKGSRKECERVLQSKHKEKIPSALARLIFSSSRNRYNHELLRVAEALLQRERTTKHNEHCETQIAEIISWMRENNAINQLKHLVEEVKGDMEKERGQKEHKEYVKIVIPYRILHCDELERSESLLTVNYGDGFASLAFVTEEDEDGELCMRFSVVPLIMGAVKQAWKKQFRVVPGAFVEDEELGINIHWNTKGRSEFLEITPTNDKGTILSAEADLADGIIGQTIEDTSERWDAEDE